MDLYYATTNPGKVISLQREFNPKDVRILKAPIDIPEPRSSDVQEIARVKVAFAYKKLRKPVVALDAGFYIPSLNGFPGTFANFALETIGLEGILKLVEGSDRICEFKECLAYQDDSLTEPKLFLSGVRGSLANQQRGVMKEYLWSRYSLIFIPEGSEKTQAEMTSEEYNVWRKILREENSPSRLFANWFSLR
jgi:XTP/dITP diphosphohydrolase